MILLYVYGELNKYESMNLLFILLLSEDIFYYIYKECYLINNDCMMNSYLCHFFNLMCRDRMSKLRGKNYSFLNVFFDIFL